MRANHQTTGVKSGMLGPRVSKTDAVSKGFRIETSARGDSVIKVIFLGGNCCLYSHTK